MPTPKPNLGERQTRVQAAEVRAIQGDDRRISIAVSSEEPVERMFGLEVLSHDKSAIDLRFFGSGRAPLLFDHDSKQQIGVVESVALDTRARMLRAVVRFSKSAHASEILDDIKDGIRLNVSVGYRVNEYETLPKDAGYRITKWAPIEASIVSIPADTSVGVGRFMESVRMNNDIDARRTVELENIDETLAGFASDRRSGRPLDTPEAAAIRAEAERVRPLANGDGTAYDALRRFVLDQRSRYEPIDTSGRPAMATRHAAPAVWTGDRDHNAYSLTRAARMAFTGERSGIEHEVGQEEARRSGRQSDGILMPWSVIGGSRAAALTSDYGPLNPTDTIPDVLPALRKKSALLASGATVMQLQQNTNLPAAGNLQSGFVVENANLPETQLNTATVALVAKTFGVFTSVSRLNLLQGIDLDAIIRQDAQAEIAHTIDRAGLVGGAANEPTGIMNTVGIGALTYANGGSISFDDVIDLLAAIEAENVPGPVSFIAPSDTKAALMGTPRHATLAAGFILDQPYEKLIGQPFAVGGNMPAGSLLAGAFGDAVVALFGPLEMIVQKSARSGQVDIGFHSAMDIGVRRVESFCKLTEAAA